jgi:hypothetical protein
MDAADGQERDDQAVLYIERLPNTVCSQYLQPHW